MKRILFLILVIIVASCNRDIKLYYDTGELKETRDLIKKNDTLNYEVITYYKNGNIKEHGEITHNKKQGYWEEWYSDNTIKWKGDYIDGKRHILLNNKDSFDIVFEDTTFKIGKSTQLRIYSKHIHPEDIVIGVNNGEVIEPKDKDLYDHTIIPDKSGILHLYLFAYSEGDTRCVYFDSVNVIR